MLSTKFNYASNSKLLHSLCVIRDLVYIRMKEGRNSIEYFHLHYFLFHYYFLAHQNDNYLNEINVVDHSNERRKAYTSLIGLASTLEESDG